MGADTDQETHILEANTQAKMRLPVDKAAYAIALAYCLAPHFATLEALGASQALVNIRGRSGDDADAMGDVLANVLVVIADASVRHAKGTLRVIAQAAEMRLPIFCNFSVDDAVPDVLSGADLLLNMPTMTTEMLALLFEAAHGEVPADVLRFSSAEKLKADTLVAHIRRGRPAADCLSGLQRAVDLLKAASKTQTIL